MKGNVSIVIFLQIKLGTRKVLQDYEYLCCQKDKQRHVRSFIITNYDFKTEAVQTAFQKYTLQKTNHIQYICQTCFGSLWRQPEKQPMISTKATEKKVSRAKRMKPLFVHVFMWSTPWVNMLFFSRNKIMILKITLWRRNITRYFNVSEWIHMLKLS